MGSVRALVLAAVAALFLLSSGSALAATTERVSVDSNEAQAGNTSWEPAISADGNYVVFQSVATNLVAGDTNGATDVFVRDRQAGTTERVSVDSSGAQATNGSGKPGISADGRYVVFQSVANNLVASDTNNTSDVFLRDRTLGTTVLVSVNSAGTQGNHISETPSISADGRYVAFHSTSTNLHASDLDSITDVFVRDLQAGTTTLVSRAAGVSGVKGNDLSFNASISADGRYVAFQSRATNLHPDDTDGIEDAFVRDLQSNTTTLVSNGGGQSPDISGDGRYVAFHSNANNLHPDDTDSAPDVFVRDLQSSTTILVSRASGASGVKSNGGGSYAAISANGRFVVFGSTGTNLVPGDTNGLSDVFVRDLVAEYTVRSSLASDGTQSTGGGSPAFSSGAPAVTSAGIVAFDSLATNLVALDSNGVADVFVRAADADGDLILEPADNCPGTASPDISDPDGDGLGTPCDNCPTVANPDQSNLDGDSHGNLCDNCPATANGLAEASVFGVGNQTDSDGDGVPGTQPPPLGTFGGDACDYDDDNDGVPDVDEWPGCRTLPEDYDGYEDTDGCPDYDNDMDGVCDAHFNGTAPLGAACSGIDQGHLCFDPAGTLSCSLTNCSNMPEDLDGFKDSDGCPEPDNDNDSFPDSTDDCPGTDSVAGADGMLGSPQDLNHNGIRDGAEAVHTTDDSALTFEDFDGVLDFDGCHDSPGDDYDGDGLTDEFEVFTLGTLPYNPDTDGDSHIDGADNCPAWANAAQNLPTWPIPANDADCDGFSTEREWYFGTNPAAACGSTAGGDLDSDNWPVDLFESNSINTTDVLQLRPVFTQSVPPASSRYDLFPDGTINTTDVLQLRPFFQMSCAP